MDESVSEAKLRCPRCATTEIGDFYIDTLDREWNRYSVQLDGDGSLEIGEHGKSLEVVGEEARVYGCHVCGTEFADEGEFTGEVGRAQLSTAGDCRVEVTPRAGVPCFAVLGRPMAGAREIRERVRAAILNKGFAFPLEQITVRLSGKQARGPGDVVIDVAILLASGQIKGERIEGVELAGELKADGTISDGSLPSLAALRGA